ncbi:MAG: glycerol-3-phosphate dehydrogenase/oxidase, partial [Acidimicrobiia bacterium]
MSFSAATRRHFLDRLGAETCDVVVVGGGITGAGVALDAASRGLRTALVERGDFASGTSSRSSKLVHGGLRYLDQREFKLVYEALAERQRLMRLAPHLVRLLPFLIPVFGEGPGAAAYSRAVGAALWMYDLTGGARIGRIHRRLSPHEALAHMPDLDASRLAAGFLYYDARADDARLTLAVIRTAVHHGAVVANYCEATGLPADPGSGRLVGVDAADRLDERRSLRISARVVVNAAGVWADRLTDLAGGGSRPSSIRPAKGVHITLPAGRPALDVAAVLPVPGDRRSVFVIPWGERVYVGTTDTDYDGPVDDPVCTAADVEYLLGALNASLTRPVHRSEVVGTWAGLRPLVQDAPSRRTADLSRRHRLRLDANGMVTIVGGKLTTYRRMARDAVDAAVRQLPPGAPAVRRSRTATLPLFGAGGHDELGGAVSAHLAGRYGGQAREVARLADSDPVLADPLVPGLPYLGAEAVYAARCEMACTVEDVLARRTRALLLDAGATAAAATATAALLA